MRGTRLNHRYYSSIKWPNNWDRSTAASINIIDLEIYRRLLIEDGT